MRRLLLAATLGVCTLVLWAWLAAAQSNEFVSESSSGKGEGFALVLEAGPDQTANPGEPVQVSAVIFGDPVLFDTYLATIDWGDGTVEPGIVSGGDVTGTVQGTHVYTGVGVYLVTVIVTDTAGAAVTDLLTVTVVGDGPFATFTATPNPAACNQAVTFDASGSSVDHPERSIMEYSWDFGDGTGSSSDEPAVGHPYSTFGTYPVTLTVTDNNSPPQTATATGIVIVNLGNLPPVAGPGGPYTAEVGGTVILDASGSSDADAGCGDSIVKYEWDTDFDGNFSRVYEGPTVSYTDPTWFQGEIRTIALRVTDSFGIQDTATTTITIHENRPIATFTATPNPAACNQVVTFDASGSSHGRPDRTIVEYTWDFGDGTGSSSAESVVEHPYSTFGAYPVTLTVTDNNSPPQTATATGTVMVDPDGNRPPLANAGGPYIVDLGATLVLDASGSTDPDAGCGDAIILYEWDLTNDGVPDLVSESASAPVVFCRPSGPGCGAGDTTLVFEISDPEGDLIDITLYVTDKDHAKETATTTITIYDNRPTASFTANPNPAACNQVVTFDASGSSHGRPDRTIVEYTWDFGDGTGSSGAGPVVGHTYSAFGTYPVTLTVTDDNSPPKTATATGTVTANLGNLPPVISTGGPYTIRQGQGLTLDASASTDPNAACGDSIVRVEWDLNNDGTVEVISGLRVTLTSDEVLRWIPQFKERYKLPVPIRLDEVDGQGARSTATTTVTMWNEPPVVEDIPDQTTDEDAPVDLGPIRFTDGDTLDTHTATINWGDGTPTEAGTVSESPFGPPGNTAGANGSVSGSHVYADNGTYTVTVCVTDDDGAESCDTLTATVNNVAPTASVIRLYVGGKETDTAPEGEPITIDGTFTDAGTADTHTATIDWG